MNRYEEYLKHARAGLTQIGSDVTHTEKSMAGNQLFPFTLFHFLSSI